MERASEGLMGLLGGWRRGNGVQLSDSKDLPCLLRLGDEWHLHDAEDKENGDAEDTALHGALLTSAASSQQPGRGALQAIIASLFQTEAGLLLQRLDTWPPFVTCMQTR